MMFHHRLFITVVSAAVIFLAMAAGGSAENVRNKIFSIVAERLTEEHRREFSAGFCNATLPLNDHLYQLVDWCRDAKLDWELCFGRGAVACLFKKYIDTLRKMPAEGGAGVPNKQDLDKRLFVFRDNLLKVRRNIESRLSSASRSAAGAADQLPDGAARFGITKFMHLSPEEFRERYQTSLKINVSQSLYYKDPTAQGQAVLRKHLRKRSVGGKDGTAFTARPDKVDWRTSGVVTPVKDQGACGACWAFAVTEVAESGFAQKYGNLLQLSVQQVTDCTQCPVCAGCNGGEICRTAQFYSVGSSSSIVEERLYPYVAKDATCRQVSDGTQVQTADIVCQGYVNREDGLLDHLSQFGTAAVAVDSHMWQYYVDGVIMHNCATDLNHAVQLVGYDLVSGPVPYYLVRNSWGTDWGLSGYLKIAVGSNLCGLAQGVVTFTAV